MPSSQYYIKDGQAIHFVTMTVVDWVDVFTRKEYRQVIVDSLKYCQQHKGLVVHSWCLMSNHLHMIVRAAPGHDLPDILRDFKKFTSKTIVAAIGEVPESRREWLLHRFEWAGKHRSNITNFKFWQDGNHAKEYFSPGFTSEKMCYIHENPVRALIVGQPEHYLFSSARNYAGLPGLLEVEYLA